MSSLRDSLGLPLASGDWLQLHHQAKLPERTRFARRLAGLNPHSVVDIGCAEGHWLDLLNNMLPASVEFTGVDCNPGALSAVVSRARDWSRRVEVACVDINSLRLGFSPVDLILVFSVSPYVDDLGGLLDHLRAKLKPGGTLVVRQYDGGEIRLGPLPTRERALIDASLRDSTGASRQFRHYDMDRMYSAIMRSSFGDKRVEFETYQRTTPFSDAVSAYLVAHAEWVCELISVPARKAMKGWLHAVLSGELEAYVAEVELVAFLRS